MKKNIILLGTLLMISIVGKAEEKVKIAIPSPAQIQWQDAEITAVFHYDLHVFDGKKYVQAQNHITPVADMNIFNPSQLDTDQWIRSVKGMGAKIAILTATHETGFALYQSDVNPYCLKAIKWRDGKGDIVRDFVNSCRKYGVKPGIYIGIRFNSFFGVYSYATPDDGSEFQKNRQIFYNKMCEGMTKELMSRYGDLAIVWYDGGSLPKKYGNVDILSVVEKYQKNIIFYRNQERADLRWNGNESGMTTYPSWGTTGSTPGASNGRHGSPYGNVYSPAMADLPLRGYKGGSWFWEPDEEKLVYPLKNLMKIYENSVGRNSTLIFGITPDPRGLIPEMDSIRMAEFGQALKQRYGFPLQSTSGEGKKIQIKLDKPSKLSHIVLQEDISKGERVLNYVLEGRKNGKWVQLAEGSCIGHKRIEVLKEPMELSAVRLKIVNSLDQPLIKNFSVY